MPQEMKKEGVASAQGSSGQLRACERQSSQAAQGQPSGSRMPVKVPLALTKDV